VQSGSEMPDHRLVLVLFCQRRRCQESRLGVYQPVAFRLAPESFLDPCRLILLDWAKRTGWRDLSD
jgi:hypothetical protein